MTKPTKEEFLKCVENHQLTVAHDDELYRHIILSNGDSWYDRFEIVTWPGHLSYSGDLGDYTFQRLDDMFKFFRGHDEPNPSYWSEKLQSVDRHGGFAEFSQEIFMDHLKQDSKYWDYDNKEKRKADQEDIEEYFQYFENEIEAKSAADSYISPFGGHRFVDFWEHDVTDYTYRFVFACYAIPWAIGKYDEYKLARAHELHP